MCTHPTDGCITRKHKSDIYLNVLSGAFRTRLIPFILIYRQYLRYKNEQEMLICYMKAKCVVNVIKRIAESDLCSTV